MHYDIVTVTYSPWLGTPTFVPPTNATVQPTCSDGEFEIALTNFNLNSDRMSGLVTGRVEVCYNSAYGSVCDIGWDEADARVLCFNYISNVLGIPRDQILGEYSDHV